MSCRIFVQFMFLLIRFFCLRKLSDKLRKIFKKKFLSQRKVGKLVCVIKEIFVCIHMKVCTSIYSTDIFCVSIL